jgi:hypothetical protein
MSIARRTSVAARMLAALAILTAAALHLYLYAVDGFDSIHVIGPLFLLNGIAGAVIGLGLLLSSTAPLVLLGVAYSVATLVAFVISATSGLFGWRESWSGTAQAVAGFTELGSALVLGALLAPAAGRVWSRSASARGEVSAHGAPPQEAHPQTTRPRTRQEDAQDARAAERAAS